MVAGTGRYHTNVIEVDNGKLLVKTGAEGVMAAVLLSVEGLPEQTPTRLRRYSAVIVRNWRGQMVGTIRTASAVPS